MLLYRGGEINRPSRPFGNPDDCIFHFYLSVNNLNPSCGAIKTSSFSLPQTHVVGVIEIITAIETHMKALDLL